MKREQLHNRGAVWTVAAFFAALWLPLLWSLFEPDSTLSRTEKRRLAPLPEIGLGLEDLAAFPSKMDTYYDDHMGFRDWLIHGHAYLKIRWLGVSPSDRLIVGKDGWLFLGHRNAIDQYRGVAPFTPRQLRRWKRILVERRDWLAQRGIEYLVVLVPNKHSMYPEFMPDNLPRVSDESQLSELARFLDQHSDVPVLDLRPALERARREHRIYHKTDTHWNDIGAYAAYQAILARLEQKLPGLRHASPTPVRFGKLTTRGMGLAQLVGLSETCPEERLVLTPTEPRAEIPPSERVRYEERVRKQLPVALGTRDPSLPRALMFRDSFANALVPYLSENFERILYVWERNLDPRIVEKESPDVVIQQLTERFLGSEPLGIGEFD